LGKKSQFELMIYFNGFTRAQETNGLYNLNSTQITDQGLCFLVNPFEASWLCE